jgi:ABC-2 type transport system ATP-binding protein
MSTANASPAAIELTGIRKHFGATAAVRDLTIRIPAGTTFGFIGPNGAGKTTTIKMLMGMLRPSGGQVRVLGLDPLADPVTLKQRVGYVPEFHAIYRSMRVGDVIAFCRRLFAQWNHGLVVDLMERFELDPVKKVKQLSKGMLAKLSLLLALAHEPEVLVLDEPMGGLDPLAREEFLDGVLRGVCDRKRTVLFSSHLLADVQRMADQVGILHAGQLLYTGSTDELLTGTKRLRAVLRDGEKPQAAPPGTIWQRIEGREWLLTVRDFSPAIVERLRAHAPVDHVEVQELGLEDIFKDLIRGQRAPT